MREPGSLREAIERERDREPRCMSTDDLGDRDCDRVGVHACVLCNAGFCSTHIDDHPHTRVRDRRTGDFVYRQAWGRP